jgi:outer membrane protein, multidrug efflux system
MLVSKSMFLLKSLLMRINKFFAISCFSLLLTGCHLHVSKESPPVEVPEEWKELPSTPQNWKNVAKECASKEEEKVCDPYCENPQDMIDNWWEIFGDPILNALEEEALASSYTLWAAVERITEARALARVNYAALMPNVYFNPSYSASGSLMDFPGAGAPGTSAAVEEGPSRFTQTNYSLPLTLNYEIDFRNSLGNAYLASQYRAEAAWEAYYTSLLLLTTDIASNYFTLRELDAEQEILRKTEFSREQALEVNRARFEAGLTLYADVTRAQTELYLVRSDRAEVKRLRAIQENVLAVLIGKPASEFCLEAQPLKGLPPAIPVGLPSELLLRRPDIAEAERTIAAAHAEIGVAYAAFYPSFNLQETIGFSSPRFSNLLSWQARLWQITVSLMQTVFDGGRNQANLSYYKARYRETVANYQQQILIAFREVEDALVSINQKASQAEELEVAVQSSTETFQLVSERYQQGLINYLDVVAAERTQLDAERSAIRVLGERFVFTIQLIKALGGGWYCD